jgi:hypothetical protein
MAEYRRYCMQPGVNVFAIKEPIADPKETADVENSTFQALLVHNNVIPIPSRYCSDLTGMFCIVKNRHKTTKCASTRATIN